MAKALYSKHARTRAGFGAVLLALSLAACATTKSAPQAGLPVASTSMALGAPVTAPDGFLNLCMRSPTDCALQDDFAERVRIVAAARDLSRERWRNIFSARYPRLAGESRPAADASADSAPQLADLADARPASIGGDEVADRPADTVVAESPAAVEALAPEAVAPAAPAPSQAVALDSATWSALKTVNRQVNRRIRKASDKDAFGVEDWWAAPLSQGLRAAGDCEDYVLEKRRALIARGVPAAALSIALVRTSWGEPHAVLVAATDRGDYVLDNLSAEVKPWRDLDYAWTARQSPTDLLTWVSLDSAAL